MKRQVHLKKQLVLDKCFVKIGKMYEAIPEIQLTKKTVLVLEPQKDEKDIKVRHLLKYDEREHRLPVFGEIHYNGIMRLG
jgi:hypothetical protein